MTIQHILKEAKKIVIKIGSNTLAKDDGTINIEFMTKFAHTCADFIAQGKKIIIVSSGAQVAGVSTLHRWTRKKDIHYRQALCAIGQVELMNQWKIAFDKSGLHIGQLLLTKDDFNDAHRSLNMRNTLFTLVDEGVIPIINENDSVSFEEIRIGDNDNLSAFTAILWAADVLILCSDIDGVYTENPKKNEQATLIEYIDNITELKNRISMESMSSFGTGGMVTKIAAAEKVTQFGTAMILANGKNSDILLQLQNGTAKASLFLPVSE